VILRCVGEMDPGISYRLARGAMDAIRDGDTVEVDPIAGRVRVLAG